MLGSQSQTPESHTNQAVDHVPDGPDVSPTENEAVGVSRETPTVVDGAEFKAVPVASIQPNPRQPRQVFDEEEMDELVHSVREIGVLQPIVVRPLEGDRYELIMGERRWRASQAAGQQTVPAVVRSTSDENLLRDALLENIHRSQLNPLEEAGAYRQLLDDFGISQEELSRRIGRSRPQISNTLRLMNLPPAAQRRVAAGVLSSGHARALLSLENEEQMEDLAQRIIAEGLSVRGAEEAASLVKRQHQDEGVSRETNRLPSSGRVQHLDEYAEALTDRLDTQVKISLGAKKGRIAIDFASMEDLNRIMQLLGSEPQ
ncbi:ParB/RepB/Spo0J family partition protein [Garicola koreensis]